MIMKYDIDDVSSKLTNAATLSKEIDSLEKINKYGTFLDSKKDIIQLYVLFIFFGIHEDIISQFPLMNEYSVD